LELTGDVCGAEESGSPPEGDEADGSADAEESAGGEERSSNEEEVGLADASEDGDADAL
jgi:hypothetical protein